MNYRNEIEAARSMLAKALQYTREQDAAKIKNLQIVIGEIAELDQDAIRSHWRELGEGTPAERAQLHFRLIKAEAQCMACFQKYHPEGGEIRCPRCGSFGAKILSGEEFYLETMETKNE
ncbi:MAG: hydrogenase maturation nickel metallochaperone HypA [Anaerolineales bacterium]|nr:hydrogenase maturation nickel metallochaperone HypA [Anaerolineales bacterium]